jgi:hypothetical protein
MLVAFDPVRGICEIGCWLEPGAVGGGLSTRSVELLMKWAFVERRCLALNGGAAPTTTAASQSRSVTSIQGRHARQQRVSTKPGHDCRGSGSDGETGFRGPQAHLLELQGPPCITSSKSTGSEEVLDSRSLPTICPHPI